MSEQMNEDTGEMVDDGAPRAGTIQRVSAVGSELAVHSETAAFAMAERARAMVQARHAVAKRCPRDLVQIHESLIATCKRPRFAESARYRKPVGRKLVNGVWTEQFAEGPSIRFVEAAAQAMGNFEVTCTTVADTDRTRTIEVMAIDFETNASWSDQITIEKTTEKSNPPKGRPIIGRRTNSQGKPTYLVAATDDEMSLKVAAIKSKVARTLAQRLIPGDIVEDAMDAVEATLRAEAKKDPEGARAKLVDRFADYGVTQADLEKYLGGLAFEKATPAQFRELVQLGVALRDGETSWSEILEASPYRAKPEAVPAGGTAAPSSITEKAKATAAKAKGKASKAEAPAPTEEKPAEPPTPPAEEPKASTVHLPGCNLAPDHSGPCPQARQVTTDPADDYDR